MPLPHAHRRSPDVDPLNRPLLGADGDACPHCAEPLAADQRYCLRCGGRRGPPRLDPVAYARAGGAARHGVARGAVVGPVAARRPAAWPLPSPRVAGIATLLVLGFGIVARTAGPARAPTPDARLGRRPRDDRPGAGSRQPRRRPRSSSPYRLPARRRRQRPERRPRRSSTASSRRAARTRHLRREQLRTRHIEYWQLGSGSSGRGPATPGSGDSGSNESSTPASGDSSTTPAQPAFKHVWLVALTGHTMDEALADPSPMPYLAGTLRPKGLLLSGYKPALPGGVANLVALVSGQRPTAEQRGNCPAYNDVDLKARTGCVFAKDVETLPGQLTAVGKTWRAYVEDSDAGQPPDTCRHPAPGGALEPVMARNPFLFFHAIVDSPDCAANTAGTSRLIPDTVDAESAPTLSLVIPNACHDGTDLPCADGAPAGPGRGRRVAEGAARAAAGLQGVQGRRPRHRHVRHRARRDQADRRTAHLRCREGRRDRRWRLSPGEPAADARGRFDAGSARQSEGRPRRLDHKPFTVRQRPRNE